MNSFLIFLKKLNWFLILNVLLLTAIGLSSIFSSSLYDKDFSNFKKQILFLGIGFFLMILTAFFDYRFLKESSYFLIFLYLFSLLILAGLFFVKPIRGARAWYKIGGFSFDPMELLKLSLILILAKYFSSRHIESYRLFHIFVSGCYLLLPTVFTFLQTNLGSALVIIGIWLGILLLSGIRIRHFLLLLFLGIILISVSWKFLLKDYQKQRILAFLFPLDPWGINWNQNQAKIAIGSGGVFGKGFGKGVQAQYGFLPEAQTDFIFAAFCEEFGFLGGVLVLILFFILFWQLLRVALISQNNFARLFVLGWTISLAIQFFINVGMNLGILPIIGLPLPFVSYGGSSLIFNFLELGIVESIYFRL
jgi:Bacterial cell division membrane protein